MWHPIILVTKGSCKMKKKWKKRDIGSLERGERVSTDPTFLVKFSDPKQIVSFGNNLIWRLNSIWNIQCIYNVHCILIDTKYFVDWFDNYSPKVSQSPSFYCFLCDDSPKQTLNVSRGFVHQSQGVHLVIRPRRYYPWGTPWTVLSRWLLDNWAIYSWSWSLSVSSRSLWRSWLTSGTCGQGCFVCTVTLTGHRNIWSNSCIGTPRLRPALKYLLPAYIIVIFYAIEKYVHLVCTCLHSVSFTIHQ